MKDLEASMTGLTVIEKTNSLPFIGHLKIESDVLVMDAKVTGAGADPMPPRLGLDLFGRTNILTGVGK